MKTLLMFIAGALLLGAVALGVGYTVWPDDILVQAGTAFALAFVPAALTLAWVLYSFRTAPEMRLLAGLGGSGFRMMIALGGGALLTRARPHLFDASFFFGWLLLFYLTLLAFEIALLVREPLNPASQTRAN